MSHAIILAESAGPGAALGLWTLEETAGNLGAPPRDVLKYWRMGLVEPLGPTERHGVYFDEEALYWMRRAERLRRDLELPPHAAVRFLRMEAELDRLRAELGFHR